MQTVILIKFMILLNYDVLIDYILYFFYSFILIILSACSGGSTKEVVENLFPNYSTEILTIDCNDNCNEADFETTEYFNPIYGTQNFLGAINASKAYKFLANNSKNWAGDNINVAVIDTGVFMHDDLLPNYSPLSHSDSLQDVDGHGTHVAGIIAASKNNYEMHGVAPNAKIISVALNGLCVTDCDTENPTLINYGIDNYDDYVIATGASVVNGSFGSDFNYVDKFENMANNGVYNLVQVYAAGNDGANNPDYPAFYANDSRVNGEIIAVVAYDVNSNNLANFTNKCDSIERCIAAPGVDIISTYKDNNYASSRGTSMAAPVVSGAVAVIQSAWPNLVGKDIVDIILTTGGAIVGTDIKLLDLEQAVQPIGWENFSLDGVGNQFSYNSLNLNIPNNFSFAFDEKFSDFLDKAVYFDGFKRDYKANLYDKINFIGSGNRIENYFMNNVQVKKINFLDNNLSFDFLFKEKDRFEIYESEYESEINNISYNFKFYDYNFNLASSDKLNQSYLQQNIFSSLRLISNSNFANYYDNLIKDNLNFTFDLGENSKNLFEFSFNQADLQTGRDLNMLNISYARIFQDLILNLNYSILKENGSLLGFSGNQAFDLARESKSNIYELSLIYEIGKNQFFSKYGILETKVDINENSFIKFSDKLKLENFNFGYFRKNKNYKYGMVLSKPWSFQESEMIITLPVGIDKNNNIVQESYVVELDEINKYDIEFFIEKEFNNSNFMFNFLIKEQNKVNNQYMGIINYNLNLN